MIAHNNDHAPDIFQIAPGTTAESLWLAEQADAATRTWAAGVAQWNRESPTRKSGPRQTQCRMAARRRQSRVISRPKAKYACTTIRGARCTTPMVRFFPMREFPVVLFMENYDINREGYHDTHDTMANIDLDYGSALAAITIEAVAQTAIAKRR